MALGEIYYQVGLGAQRREARLLSEIPARLVQDAHDLKTPRFYSIHDRVGIITDGLMARARTLAASTDERMAFQE